MKKLLLLIILCSSFSFTASHLAPGIKSKQKPTAIDEILFNQTIDDFTSIFSPLFHEQGVSLLMKRDWSSTDGDVLDLDFSNNVFSFTVPGGFAKAPLLDINGFRIFICHELAHYLGGSPLWKKPVPNYMPANSYQWRSGEAESDYYASSKCIRRYYSFKGGYKLHKERIEKVIKTHKSDSHYMKDYEVAQKRCQQVFKSSKKDKFICIRSLLGAMNLSYLLAYYYRQPRPSFTTPSKDIVTRTDPKYVSAQCRMDTLFQGALCSLSFKKKVDRNNPLYNNCTEKIHSFGARPKCWFNSAEY